MGTVTAGLPIGSQDGVWIRQEATVAARARRAAAELGRRIGLRPERLSEIELAVTEVAVNLNKHAVDGALLLRLVECGDGMAVELLGVDHGPGIADVVGARRDGTSSSGTLGIGLGAVERMADAFDVFSLPGRGTVLLARFRERPEGRRHLAAACPEPVVAGLTRALSGEEMCGDAWAVRPVPALPGQARQPAGAASLVMLCDGLGHGPLAARASEHAVAAFHRSPSTDPAQLLTTLHGALAGTRGGAIAVARVDPSEGTVSYCGVGNISGFVVADGRRSVLLSAPGIVGHHLPRLRVFDVALPAGADLVLHSDGLSERWSPAALPGLFECSSTVVAAHLLREAAVRRDDASVLVVKGAGRGPGAP